MSVGQPGAAMGNTSYPIDLVNMSGSTCLLAGYPPSLQGVENSGSVVRLDIEQGTYFGDPGPTADLDSGGSAALIISGADACQAAQDGHQAIYPTLRIGLPGGGSVDVDGRGFDTICGVSVSPFGVPADIVSPEPGQSPSPLSAQINAPSSAVAGQTLRYTVTLTNPTASVITLAPCPSYTEFVGTGSATGWVATVLDDTLNCSAVPSIGPGASVTFAMQLALPTDQPSGSAKFGWDVDGGTCPCANAPLEVVRRSSP